MENATEKIIVTGFGPFGQHAINASWEAVKLLPDKINNYEIHKEEVSVLYLTVEDKIPKLWNALKPKLVIHVGVSAETKIIILESKAHRDNYDKPDCCGFVKTSQCLDTDKECLETSIDVKNICKELYKKNKELKFGCSAEAGRYLCEYIYYNSLKQDVNRTLFVHVPVLNNPYSASQLAEAIKQIIEYILQNSKN